MFSMEKLTNNIAEKISSELGLDNERKEVIAYGIFALLQTILAMAVTIIIGYICGVWFEALIISLAASILRKYSGGVHASSPGTCAYLGAIIIVGLALGISIVIKPFLDIKVVLILGLIGFIYSYYVINKLAPVDSAAKPIRTEKKRERMKKGSILILVNYIFIVFISIILYLFTGEKKLLVFSLCIYGGTVWQAFTLTSIGHLIINKIDSFLNQIVFYGRRK